MQRKPWELSGSFSCLSFNSGLQLQGNKRYIYIFALRSGPKLILSCPSAIHCQVGPNWTGLNLPNLHPWTCYSKWSCFYLYYFIFEFEALTLGTWIQIDYTDFGLSIKFFKSVWSSLPFFNWFTIILRMVSGGPSFKNNKDKTHKDCLETSYVELENMRSSYFIKQRVLSELSSLWNEIVLQE